MSVLSYFLYIRAKVIWDNRNLPSYLGPSGFRLAHLFILIVVNGLTLFALMVLFVSAAHSLAINTTMIEQWEIERHEALIQRSRRLGGFVNGPEGRRIRIVRQEFPYDIGIWKNICQGMGTSNPIAWFLPFGGGPGMDTGAKFETNGFEDAGTAWPPPDPDRMPKNSQITPTTPFMHQDDGLSTSQQEIQAFRERQEADYQRYGGTTSRPLDSIKPTVVGKDEEGNYFIEGEDGQRYSEEYEEGLDGEAGWTNSDGDRLRDYGVDEEEEDDEDDIPLGELLRRRRAKVD
jgi:palmitoyltransferase